MTTKSGTEKQRKSASGQRPMAKAVKSLQGATSTALYSDTTCEVSTMMKPEVLSKPITCTEVSVLDVSSSWLRTDLSGKSTFRLSQFICPIDDVLFIGPIHIVATPISPKPHFLTVKQTLVNNGADVEITVFAWDAKGLPAPQINFNWRCRVQHTTSDIIL